MEAVSEDIKFSVAVNCVWCIGLYDSSVLRDNYLRKVALNMRDYILRQYDFTMDA